MLSLEASAVPTPLNDMTRLRDSLESAIIMQNEPQEEQQQHQQQQQDQQQQLPVKFLVQR
ncbi:hypothetical protein Mp_8g02210 [Marchantia polymorpha subsp. ruderalis]|uniref:Uncharacterized protein n=1 Tax=Marchantia polymorpha TaxID=3197 RepID=A0A2R6XIW8_MARPO|nr:hypothetical protein MARPO_0012s0018 [Marchantia polymorpha]BBN18406.1 hypothetical protein Mp_8g02210 [Marchantia polymorpha subsp. ruderalis]|eukprot:PTQ46053.1 hypothetical protein MARPO_0012s0018 [Marchantia polymorpha]